MDEWAVALPFQAAVHCATSKQVSNPSIPLFLVVFIFGRMHGDRAAAVSRSSEAAWQQTSRYSVGRDDGSYRGTAVQFSDGTNSV